MNVWTKYSDLIFNTNLETPPPQKKKTGHIALKIQQSDFLTFLFICKKCKGIATCHCREHPKLGTLELLCFDQMHHASKYKIIFKEIFYGDYTPNITLQSLRLGKTFLMAKYVAVLRNQFTQFTH